MMAYCIALSLRRRLGSLAGGDRLFSSESSHQCVCLCSSCLHCLGCFGRHLADALSPFCLPVDSLSPFYSGGCFAAAVVLVGDCFGQMFWRLGGVGWISGCMCHLYCVVDLCTFGVVVSFSWFSCMVLSRFVGSSIFPLLFLLFLFVVGPSYQIASAY